MVRCQAHNLETVIACEGSTPSPATKEQKIGCSYFYVWRVQEVKSVELFSINGEIGGTMQRQRGGCGRFGWFIEAYSKSFGKACGVKIPKS